MIRGPTILDTIALALAVIHFTTLTSIPLLPEGRALG